MNEPVCMPENWFSFTVMAIIIVVMVIVYLTYALGVDTGQRKERKRRGF